MTNHDGSVTTGQDLPLPQIALDQHDDTAASRTQPTNLASPPEPESRPPGFHSPLRHHRRTPSTHREVKETLDAVTEYPSEGDGAVSHHRVNQYVIKDEIGRGSYGAVHLAVDQFDQEYAVKEFSKVRLRRRAQSEMLRNGPQGPVGPRRFPGAGLNGPLFRRNVGGAIGPGSSGLDDALHFIRGEIAIMKKLNHPNLVQLIEVLDDPEEDSLWMVLEMCKKGVVMKVDLGKTATPYDEEQCRCWFRDLILGIEYLHAQSIIHRDIKPDNLLIDKDDVLKVVDFGVSEMFEKPCDQMITAKSAGSPAFLAPELCVIKHGDVDGRAADIWSMGVTLYCLRYGKLPFDHPGVVEIYEAIKSENPAIPDGENADFVDLLGKILEKDPAKRISMGDLRVHPWVTRSGEDPLLPAEKNCAEFVEPPNELELSRAFTRKMNHLLCVMKAIQKFKIILLKHRGERDSPRNDDGTLATTDGTGDTPSGSHADEIRTLVQQRRDFLGQQTRQDYQVSSMQQKGTDLTNRKPVFLGIGAGTTAEDTTELADENAVCESPTNADSNLYDQAYEEEVKKIIANPDRRPTMYLTKFVKDKEHYKTMSDMIDGITPEPQDGLGQPQGDRFAQLVARTMSGNSPSSPSNRNRSEADPGMTPIA